MEEKNEVTLYLRITGFDSEPDEITSALGVTPSKVWRTGELMNDYSPRVYKGNGWRLDSGLNSHSEFVDHLHALLSIIEPRLDAFTEVCNRYHTELTCVIYMDHNAGQLTPWVHFDKRASRILTQIGAEIDFDMYVLPGDDQ